MYAFGLRISVFIALVACLGATLVALPQRAEALSGGEFNAGMIISDQKFFDVHTMSEGSIQGFLNGKVPACTAGYVCLKDYRMSTYTRGPVEAGHCNTYPGEANELASRIIYKAAMACGINPQVLLVLLQKETGLITATRPTDGTYRKAMGYGCPDTSSCDAAFYGFYNQVYKAAWQFRQYTNYPARTYRIGNVSIGWHPNAACGSSIVNIQNQATANLYNYTPYRPNGAALANLGGTGDACSSYGNRNFWVYFTTWFGSTALSGAAQIANLYAQQGGADGWLGGATSGLVDIGANGGGIRQMFVGGFIYWSPEGGAQVVSVPILAEYGELGQESGNLGWPTGAATNVTANGRAGTYQTFQFGNIYHNATDGAIPVSGGLRTTYVGVGAMSSSMGWPIADPEYDAANGGGWAQRFQVGVIYWVPGAAAQIVSHTILTAYGVAGGQAGVLGWPSGAAANIAANGGGVGQVFQGGSIYSSPAGAFTVSGPIRDLYWNLAGEGGSLGWPIGARSCGSSSGVCTQDFQHGTISWTPSTGSVSVSSPEIAAVHTALGGSSGSLGAAVSTVYVITANGGGLAQAFQNGSIYWSAASGGFAVTGAIRSAYWSALGEGGLLGWPVSAAGAVSANGGGIGQRFQYGSIYQPTNGAAYIVYGAVRDVYWSVSGEGGVLGWPGGSAGHVAANGGGIGQRFQNGSIYWSPASGGFAVTGDIRSAYWAALGEGGLLGWPVGPAGVVSANGGGIGQRFQNGSIYQATNGGAYVVYGAVRDVYFSVSGESGVLGWPTGAAGHVAANGGGIGQRFQSGSIYWSGNGGFAVTGATRTAYWAASGEGGVLGWPVSIAGAVSANGGGTGQRFQGGSIYSSSAGAFPVGGAIRDFYWGLAGEGGSLGWPTGLGVCGLADGGCSQAFQNGTILWTPALGARRV